MKLSDLLQRAKGLPAPKTVPENLILRGWVYRDRHYGAENYSARSKENDATKAQRWRTIHCVWLTQGTTPQFDRSVFNTLRLSTQT